MRKKCFISILIVLLLITSLPVVSIANAANETIKKLIQTAETTTNTVDLTNLAIGEDASHTHIYEKKYNDNYHWEECWICGNIKNRVAHHIKKTEYTFGYASCNPGNQYTQYCTDGCGYTKTLKDPCTSDGK